MTAVHELPETAPAAVARGGDLLHDYRPSQEFFFASPHRTLLTSGVRATVPDGPEPVYRRVAAALAAADRSDHDPVPMVVGAIPFDHDGPAHLVLPDRVRWAGPLSEETPADAPAPSAGHDWQVRPVPAPEVYEQSVAEAVALIRTYELSKVVLARALDLRSPEPIAVAPMLRRLARRDPGGYTFAVGLPERRTLIGASPELLLSRRGSRVVANPLAGSLPRAEDPAEDEQRARALLASAKDQHEHAVVVDAIHKALAPYCTTLDVPARPVLIRTAAMWHLSTTLVGELADPDTTALELACALHPTPAVCGEPTSRARQVIGDLEPFDRGLYTGMVGWSDAHGDGEWVVTIRCAEVAEHTMRLFAGAGIVGDSSPAAELAETSAKFRTLLHAAGVDR
ncbi:isochorismate synthase [Kitasatospora sp. MAA4]|uniref:isochorismate synthase DhbC n=1 Tax=Kitasatospora sp. MAA4 TaxID=3035093 RepID=UPI002475ECDB|nr:isochorismate synthase DhbC [Kitasatospora sp. MAA4]MDH6130787.1 isochorismate synthase [Kitasatospora sp. MAA4]